MSLSYGLAGLWLVLVVAIAFAPPRVRARAVFVLVALGIPILGLATYEHGPFIGLLLLTGGALVMRWPFMRLGNWLRRLRAEGPK